MTRSASSDDGAASDGRAALAQLLRRVIGLRDVAFRVQAVHEFCRDQPAEVVVRVLGAALDQARTGPAELRLFLDALMHVFVDDRLGYDRVTELYGAAKALEQERVSLYLLPTPPGVRPSDEGELPFDPELSQLPLGWRKALARRGKVNVLERLLADPDPAVITLLLDNPRLTERDVLRLATRRPNKVEVLEVLIRSRRWINQGAVRRAVVRNPYTPLEYGVRLLQGLNRSELREVVRDETLHEALRRMAERYMSLAPEAPAVRAPADDGPDDTEA